MALFDLDLKNIVRSPEEIREFVQNLMERNGKYRGVEKRFEPRLSIALPVVAIQVDTSLQPTGVAFIAMTRNISDNGIAVLHIEPVDSPLLAVDLTDPEGCHLQAVFEILRHRANGNYFESAGTFVTKLYDAPRVKRAHSGNAQNRLPRILAIIGECEQRAFETTGDFVARVYGRPPSDWRSCKPR